MNFGPKLAIFLAVLRKITDFLLSYGLYLSYKWIKIRNPLFIVKKLKNRQFLTKIHKAGRIWSTTRVSTESNLGYNFKF